MFEELHLGHLKFWLSEELDDWFVLLEPVALRAPVIAAPAALAVDLVNIVVAEDDELGEAKGEGEEEELVAGVPSRMIPPLLMVIGFLSPAAPISAEPDPNSS